MKWWRHGPERGARDFTKEGRALLALAGSGSVTTALIRVVFLGKARPCRGRTRWVIIPRTTEGTGGKGWADAGAKALERAAAKARRAAYERRQSKRFRVHKKLEARP